MPDKTQGEYVEIRIGANPEYLALTRMVAQKMSSLSGLSESDADNVTLAIEEALTNVIRHGYGGPCSEPIIVRICKTYSDCVQAEALEIEIRDFGKQVDPETIKSRDLDDVKPGGLGVHIIQSIMDDVTYSPMADGGMLLRMIKRIEPVENDNERKNDS